jgi:type IV secretion system protein VirD4
VVAGPERGALVLGPPRSGKTSSVVVPSILAAPGAVLTTSTKPDVLASTADARGRLGTCWLFDPSGTVEAPEGVEPLRWSPVCRAGSWDGAVAAASALVATARPGAGLSESSHWSERAEALLSSLLHAAALSGSELEAVLQWVHRREVKEPVRILDQGGTHMAHDVLAGIMATERREQSGIFSTAAGALSAYRSSSALSGTSRTNFSPETFVASRDTVHVCAPSASQATLAPVVVSFVDAVRVAALDRVRLEPPLLLALDEVANIAPLPSLPSLVSEGGSHGVVTLACLQDLSQARARWGQAADGFVTLFSSTLLMPGIADVGTLELASALAGRVPPSGRSTTRRRWPGGSVTRSRPEGPRLPVDEVSRGQPGHGLLLAAGQAPSWVRLTPWYGFSPWREAVLGSSRDRAEDKDRSGDPAGTHRGRGPSRPDRHSGAARHLGDPGPKLAREDGASR